VLRSRDARGVSRDVEPAAGLQCVVRAMLTALQQELDGVAKNEGARAVVLAAAGKAFCRPRPEGKRAAPSLEYYQRLFAQCGAMMMSVQRLGCR